MRLFLDESGNSGGQVYDQAQPVFALAGVWLDAESEAHFAQRVDTLRTRHGMQSSGELKGRVLVKSPRGCGAVAELINELTEANVPISLLGVDKSYFPPGVIVEDCTDCDYNKEFGEVWKIDKLRQAVLIQLVADHADSHLLEAAWQARAGLKLEDAKAAYGALFAQLERCDKVSVFARSMAKVDFDEWWSRRETERQRGMGYSPNLTAFTWMMRCSEAQAVRLDFADVALIHDEQAEFREAFSYWWDVVRDNDEHAPMLYADGTPHERLLLERLVRLEFSDSKQACGIQIADLLASSLRIVMQGLPSESVSILVPSLHRACMAQTLSAPFPRFFGTPRWQRSMLGRLNLPADPSIPT